MLTFGLFLYHTFLLSKNITTNEHLKKMWELKSGNPFDKYGMNHTILEDQFLEILVQYCFQIFQTEWFIWIEG